MKNIYPKKNDNFLFTVERYKKFSSVTKQNIFREIRK